MTLKSEFNAQKINADYANLLENMPKIFDRVEMTMKDFEVFLLVLKNYATNALKFNKSCANMGVLNKVQPDPTDNESKIDHIQDFIRSNAKVHEQQFETLLKHVTEAQKTIKKIVKESQKHKNNYNKVLKTAQQKVNEINKLNLNKETQLQKIKSLESTNKQKYDQEVSKINAHVEKQLQKIKNIELKCDKQMKQSLKDLAVLDKNRLVLIFQANELFYTIMQNVGQNTLDLTSKISQFYQKRNIQDLIDQFISKNQTSVTSFTFKSLDPGSNNIKINPEAENVFVEAKPDMVKSSPGEEVQEEEPQKEEEKKE